MYIKISEGMSESLLGHERFRLSGRYRTECARIYQLVRLVACALPCGRPQ
jgi:hypothetical protein